MQFKTNVFLTMLSVLNLATATPIALAQNTNEGADSCPTEPLSEATWTKLKVDDFLKSTGPKLTTKNVQGFASSLGAPNFFCGLDKFCNAGQPCLPVDLPGWYALVAVQNYNSYMNSLNTAISFAASIMSLEMPAVINDFWPSPPDDSTPFQELTSMITLALSVVPFTGPLKSVSSAPKGVTGFLESQVQTPKTPNLFVKWSELGTSIASAVKDYQSSISTSLQNTLDAAIDDPTSGINSVLAGGGFLGVSQNFTQTDMQTAITDSLKLRSIALALQGRKAFIYRSSGGCFNSNNDASKFCATVNGVETQFALRMGDEEQQELAGKIINTYGISKEIFLQGPSTCFDQHKVQLYTPEMLPVDSKAPCIFNLPVCTFDSATFPGRTIVENCKLQGIDV
ncbi:uncharacterized protein BROUX77_005125 [Berkeleyomyces rouxiae]|uniref:uncharacterized protein n=1 Tax=Berkeleyomyces rouxiae TaxID=2035830 RepID=UPI003B8106AE